MTSKLQFVYEQIDLPLIPCLVEMEQTGCLIDIPKLLSIGKQLDARLIHVHDCIQFMAGDAINLDSPAQVAALLYDRLGLPLPRKHGVATRSTDKAALAGLLGRHPIVEPLAEYRRLTKLKSTYVDKIPQVLSTDGRLRSHFNATRVETGRLSSSDPINLQNIPVRAEPGTPESVQQVVRQIRQAWIPSSGNVLVIFDQSQVEYRILACMAQDAELIELYKSGIDVHSATAARYIGIGVYEFDQRRKQGDVQCKSMRDLAKNVNYGWAYGQTSDGLAAWGNANGIPMTNKQAASIQQGMARTPIVRYIQQAKSKIRRTGYAETYFGRQAYYADLQSDKPWELARALREGFNMTIQGTAADVMKQAMTRIRTRRLKEGLTARQILAVHDEVVYDTPVEEADRLSRIMVEEAEHVVDWAIPLSIDVKVVHSWGEGK